MRASIVRRPFSPSAQAATQRPRPLTDSARERAEPAPRTTAGAVKREAPARRTASQTRVVPLPRSSIQPRTALPSGATASSASFGRSAVVRSSRNVPSVPSVRPKLQPSVRSSGLTRRWRSTTVRVRP
jgi:hypothetical protein